jgi:sulfur-oxidizing protein SoxY
LIPGYFVREIAATYGGERVLVAQVDSTISENPNLRFYFVVEKYRERRVEVVDTRNRRVHTSVRVERVQ